MTSEENSGFGSTSLGSPNLTEEQKQFLEACEAEFADRYTELDPEFMLRSEGSNTPPIVDPWYNKPRRNFDWAQQSGGREQRQQNWGGRNERHNDNRGYQHHRQTYRNNQRNKPY